MGIKKMSAIVILKEHSDRVPGKNMKDMNGRPLFFHILESLSNAKYITNIFIDTANKTIADMAKENFDVKIIDRSPDLLDDNVTANQLIEYDLPKIEDEHIFFTHATNPLLTSETMDKAIEKYFELSDKYDSLFSVNRIQKRVYNKDGDPINHEMGTKLKMTQDLDPIFVETSSFFIFPKATFNRYGRRIGDAPFLFELNNYESMDIDYPKDFLVAEAIIAKNQDREIY